MNEQIDQFITKEKEKRYKEMIHSINREKKRKKVERVPRRNVRYRTYAERLDKAALSG